MDLGEIEEKYNTALKLVSEGNEREALMIINRCMRALEKYIQGASGVERIKAVMLLRNLGKIQTELSNRQFNPEKD